MLSPRFVRGLQRNLSYWQKKTSYLSDSKIQEIDSDFPNLVQVLDMGLALAETNETAVNLILQCFFWVEHAGHLLQWHHIIKKAIKTTKSENPLQLPLLKQFGQFLYLQWEFDSAIQTLTQAETLAIQKADTHALSGIYHTLCQIYRRQHNYEQAQSYGQQALATVSPKDTRLHAIILQSLGQCAQEQGNYATAETYLQESLNLQSNTPFVTDKTRTMTILAIIKQDQEQFAASLLLYEEAFALLKDTKNQRDKIEILLNQGSLLFSLGQLNEAEIIFLKAERMLQTETGLSFFKGLVANNLGCINRDRGNFATAEWYFQKSIATYKVVNEQLFLANAWGNYAKLKTIQKIPEDAIQHYKTALKILKKYPQNAFARESITDYEDQILNLTT